MPSLDMMTKITGHGAWPGTTTLSDSGEFGGGISRDAQVHTERQGRLHSVVQDCVGVVRPPDDL